MSEVANFAEFYIFTTLNMQLLIQYKILIIIVIGLLFSFLVLKGIRKIKSDKQRVLFKDISNLFIYFIPLMFWVLIDSGNNLVSNIIALLSLGISVYTILLFFKLLDKFDLKKGYKAEQHKLVVDYLYELFSIKYIIHFQSNYKNNNLYFDIEFFNNFNNKIENDERGKAVVYFTSEIYDQINSFVKFYNHPYFPSYFISQFINEPDYYILKKIEGFELSSLRAT